MHVKTFDDKAGEVCAWCAIALFDRVLSMSVKMDTHVGRFERHFINNVCVYCYNQI